MKLESTKFALHAAVAAFALCASTGRAENWVFVDAMVFSAGCSSWDSCVDTATETRRNIMTMDDVTTASFLHVLDSMAEFRNIPMPDAAGNVPDITEPSEINLMDIVPALTVLEVTKSTDVLRGLPGVYFDASRVTGDGASDRFVREFSAQLIAAGIPVLTEEDALLLPGAAKLSVSLSQSRENAGCVFPFRASLTLKEEVVLVREPTIKFETTSWTYGIGQNFTAVNYLGYDALTDAAQRFIDDYRAANAR